jgi:ATP synthase protein I
MAQRKPPPAQRGDSGSSESGHGDPWLAFGYLVSGVLMYGLIGWALDQWWGTSFLVVVGILVGAGLGIYMTWARFRETGADSQDPKST